MLDALAAAGELNVSLTNIPQQRVTLHMGRPVTRDGMVELMKSGRRGERAQGDASADADADRRVRRRSRRRQTAGSSTSRAAAAAAEPGAADAALHVSAQARERGAARAGVDESVLGFVGAFADGGGHDDHSERERRVHDINAGGGRSTPGDASPATSRRSPAAVRVQTRAAVAAARGEARRSRQAAGSGNQAVQNALANARSQQVNGSLSNQAGDIRIIAEESSNSLLVRATDTDFALVQQIIGGRRSSSAASADRGDDRRGAAHARPRSRRVGERQAHPNGKTRPTSPRRRRRTASARDFILQLTGGTRHDQVQRRDRGAAGARRRARAVAARHHRAEQPAGGAQRRLVASVRAGVADGAERSDAAACRRCSTSTSARCSRSRRRSTPTATSTCRSRRRTTARRTRCSSTRRSSTSAKRRRRSSFATARRR